MIFDIIGIVGTGTIVMVSHKRLEDKGHDRLAATLKGMFIGGGILFLAWHGFGMLVPGWEKMVFDGGLWTILK